MATRVGRRSTRCSNTTPTSSRATPVARWSHPRQPSSASTTPGAARRTPSSSSPSTRTRAQEVVEKLKEGDFESIGVNGQAVVDEEAGIAGVWVAGVAPGSPADDVELLPGDIIQTMNGIPIGTDGTMADYCDVLRTSGDNPIRSRCSASTPPRSSPARSTATSRSSRRSRSPRRSRRRPRSKRRTTTYDSYTTIVDDTGALTIDLPTAWTSLDTAPVTLDDGSVLPQITGAPDLTSYYETWDTPGIFFSVVPSADILQCWRRSRRPICVDGGQSDYQDAAFLGTYQLWTDCGGTDTIFVVLGAPRSTAPSRSPCSRRRSSPTPTSMRSTRPSPPSTSRADRNTRRAGRGRQLI